MSRMRPAFPSGGLRATFEARGYTAWDPTSYAFVKDHTLYIPTVFCSYSGEALDKKTPLLRSMEVLNKQALRVLTLLGNTDAYPCHYDSRSGAGVFPDRQGTVPDQREDLRLCRPHAVRRDAAPRVRNWRIITSARSSRESQAFMEDLNEELWKLGVFAKTEHNEVAPAQHELAPVFTNTNIATDHNQLTMEIMKKVAQKHDLVCLLHEKPFDGVNGSGKHNNWSLSTNTGVNLLEPGETLRRKTRSSLLFLAAVIKAVDEYQDLLRISVASAGNDHRLGANEAPPAIISMFLGDELTAVLESIENEAATTQWTRRR